MMESHTSTGLQPADWVIIVIYAASTIGLGAWFARRQKSTREYFLGSGQMNWLLIGVSLFATLLSTITYLSTPGEVIGKGPADLVKLLALPLAYAVVGYWLLPVYMRHRVTSAYELLEEKLGLSTRLLGVGLFLVLRLVWMSVLVYMAAKAMVVMMRVDEKWIPTIVIATGAVSVIYTSLGGLRAVVITDLLQTILLFGGAALVLIVATVDAGGLGWIPTRWHEQWDHQPVFSTDPSVRITMVGSFLSLLTWMICTAGGDQVSVQRFMATRDAQAARRSYGTQLAVNALVTLTLGLVGLALLYYYERHSQLLPAGFSLKKDADDVFPLFIANQLPPGVSGFVVAAMFAAGMSSIDSGVNSITAVVMTDLLDRFDLRPRTERAHVLAARILALSIGIVVVVGSLYVGRIEGNFFTVTNKTVNLLPPVIFSLFFFALFIPFANAPGVWVGCLMGTATAALIAFSGEIFGYHKIADPKTGKILVKLAPVTFQWMGPASLAVNLVTGTFACWIFRRRSTTA